MWGLQAGLQQAGWVFGVGWDAGRAKRSLWDHLGCLSWQRWMSWRTCISGVLILLHLRGSSPPAMVTGAVRGVFL